MALAQAPTRGGMTASGRVEKELVQSEVTDEEWGEGSER